MLQEIKGNPKCVLSKSHRKKEENGKGRDYVQEDEKEEDVYLF